MGFAHPRRAKEDHILPVLQETHGGQFIDLALIDRGLEGNRGPTEKVV